MFFCFSEVINSTPGEIAIEQFLKLQPSIPQKGKAGFVLFCLLFHLNFSNGENSNKILIYNNHIFG